TGGKNSLVRLHSLDGEEVAFAIEGLGWRQGGLQLGGIALPDGVIATIGPVQLIIEEFGLVNENSASYISFSGGLGIERPMSFEGSVRVKRLRFRQSGNPAAPPFLLDGIFLRYLSETLTTSTLIEVGGMYSERMVSGDRVRELGL